MEMLRFDDEPTATPKRKRSSHGLLAVAFFAMVLGVGSAFASNTISINGGANVDLGQGVTQFVVCDESILVTPATSIDLASDKLSKSTFYLSQLQIQNLDDTSDGCASKNLKIKIYDGDKSLYPCTSLTPNSTAVYDSLGSIDNSVECTSSEIKVHIPGTGTSDSSDVLTITFPKIVTDSVTLNNSDISNITVESATS